jgi:alanine racemase
MISADARPARVRIDLDAIRHNTEQLVAAVAPAEVCVVVKADAYGHGAVPAANAAIAGGAHRLGVALVDEGLALRSSGLRAPILVLSEPPAAAMASAHGAWLIPTLYTPAGVAAARAVAADGTSPWSVHVKVNTGMNRVGAEVSDLAGIVAAVRAAPELSLEGIWTHFANADHPDDPLTALQLERFEAAVAGCELGDDRPILHAANSAAALSSPATRLDMVRCGIAAFGVSPSSEIDVTGLRPALSLVARVAFVKRVAAGSALSYGQLVAVDRDTNVATVPVGYADGVPRRLGLGGGEVLIGGRRRRILGSVTMDQLMVDCGDDPVAVGDEVVLLGSQGALEIDAVEWAERLDLIPYEVLCGFGPRLKRSTRPLESPS